MTRRGPEHDKWCGPINRFTLPIPDPVHVGVTNYDAKDPDTSFPPMQPVRPPDGAPNVLLAVRPDYDADGNEFPGVINWVQIETGKADNRHLISPEDRWRVALARQ